ncbi:MAG: ribonuclease P protein component [Firmicutes bacterium]|nr:ribonuclease P protein component [Bacillota bacterium]
MKKANRLTNNASFSYIYKHGKAVHGAVLAVHFVVAGSIKVGISVSKKIGKSVIRSKVKRRIKESFRHIIPLLSAKCNYVVSAKEGIAEKDFAYIDKELRALLKRVKHLD